MPLRLLLQLLRPLLDAVLLTPQPAVLTQQSFYLSLHFDRLTIKVQAGLLPRRQWTLRRVLAVDAALCKSCRRTLE